MGHPSRTTLRKNRLKAAVAATVEALESRQLLSATLDGPVLTITGTSQADNITLRTAANADNLKVVVNGDSTLFAKADIQQVIINTLAGDDRVTMFALGDFSAPSIIHGGAGDDILQGASANDQIFGDAGADVLIGGAGNDTLVGGSGGDTLSGGQGDDLLKGSSGNDRLTRDGGTDHLVGGAGDNAIDKAFIPKFTIGNFTSAPDQLSNVSVNEVRNAYGLGDLANKAYTNRGKGQAIAIIGAFHTPRALSDLQTFSRQFGLPIPNKKTFQQVYVSGRKPGVDEEAAGEAMLDIEWAHAIAPDAKIYLIEANALTFGDLFPAVSKAVSILNRKHGGGVVSMSLGLPDQDFEQSLTDAFSSNETKNISFIASAGDTGAEVSYPATDVNVTSVGGTTLYTDFYGNRLPGPMTYFNTAGNPAFPSVPLTSRIAPGGESAWIDGGGGISQFIPEPAYQQNRGFDTDGRLTPDVSMIGDFEVPIYITSGNGGQAGWATIAGTSAGAPMFAGMIALANQLRAQNHKHKIGNQLQETIWRLGGQGANGYFNDIDNGFTAGPNNAFLAGPGYDLATGWGTPKAEALLPALAGIKNPHFINTTIDINGSQTLYDPTNGAATGTTGNGGGGGTGTTTGGVGGTGSGNNGNGGTGGAPGGGAGTILTNQFRSGRGQTQTRLSGLYTLTMDPIHLTQVFSTVSSNAGAGGVNTSGGANGGNTSGSGTGGTGSTGGGTGNGSSTYTVDFFGIDSQTSEANPDIIDPSTGNIIGLGTPITLYRNGNTISGVAYYEISNLGATGNSAYVDQGADIARNLPVDGNDTTGAGTGGTAILGSDSAPAIGPVLRQPTVHTGHAPGGLHFMTSGATAASTVISTINQPSSGNLADASGAVKFIGTVDKKGHVSGQFYAIDINGVQLKNAYQNPLISVINGHFSS